MTEAGGTSYTFDVTYSDDVAVNVSSLRSNNIFVSAPGTPNSGWMVTYLGVNDATNGTPRVATYRMYVPGGSWDAADNGVYTVRLNPYEIRDTVGNQAGAAVLGTFTVAVSDRDWTAPIAMLTSAPILSQAGITNYEFQVTYTDNVAIRISSLDSPDIVVTGPNGFLQNPIFVGVDLNTDGTPPVATYRVPARRGLEHGKQRNVHDLRESEPSLRHQRERRRVGRLGKLSSQHRHRRYDSSHGLRDALTITTARLGHL